MQGVRLFLHYIREQTVLGFEAVEHDPPRAASKESAIRQHAEITAHDIHPRRFPAVL